MEFVRVDGGTKIGDRQTMVDSFQKEGSGVDVIISSLKDGAKIRTQEVSDSSRSASIQTFDPNIEMVFNNIIAYQNRYQSDIVITCNHSGPYITLIVQAGGTGLNLTAADRVVLMDLSWNPQDNRQAEDRAHRLGQTRPVTVTYMTARAPWQHPDLPTTTAATTTSTTSTTKKHGNSTIVYSCRRTQFRIPDSGPSLGFKI